VPRLKDILGLIPYSPAFQPWSRRAQLTPLPECQARHLRSHLSAGNEL